MTLERLSTFCFILIVPSSELVNMPSVLKVRLPGIVVCTRLPLFRLSELSGFAEPESDFSESRFSRFFRSGKKFHRLLNKALSPGVSKHIALSMIRATLIAGRFPRFSARSSLSNFLSRLIFSAIRFSAGLRVRGSAFLQAAEV